MDLINQSSQHELQNLLTTFLGVPGYIISTFFPAIQQLAVRQPRLVKAVCIFVALTTFGFSILERIKRTMLSFLVSYFMFSTTIDYNDPLYTYVIRWLRNRRKILPEQELQARSKEDLDRNSGIWTPQGTPLPPDEVLAKEDVVYDFSGLQIFWHNWRPYFVSPFPRGRIGSPTHLTVRCFGFSPKALKDVIDEAWKIHRENDQARLTAVYRPIARSGGWKCVARRNRRSLSTIVLDPTEKDQLLEDVSFYLAGEAREWYAARGIPYRRGYLFHGRPGTGKTSLSMAIAGQFGLDIYIISLLDPHINDTFLHTFFTNLPKGALILLEDIDSAGLARETFEKSLVSYGGGRRARSSYHTVSTRVTLSGLLNAIDGADSPEGHLLIMTTNVPEALDEALIRPGRIDYKIGFRAISPPQARAIFMRMYTDDVDKEVNLEHLADTFCENIPDDVFTPAELQGHLLRHKRKPVEALETLDDWKNGIIDERRKLDEARQKEEERIKKQEKRRKAKQKARRGSMDPTDSDLDSGPDSSYSDAVQILDRNEYEPSYFSELNGDPKQADLGFGDIQYVDNPMGRHPPPQHRDNRRRRDHRSPNWKDLNGRERTCATM